MIKLNLNVILILIGFLGLILIGSNSCTHESVLLDNLDTICFEQEILPIIQTSCGISGCHNSVYSEGFSAVSYNTIINAVKPGYPNSSLLYKVITNINGEQIMPPDQPLNKEQRTAIMIWISQGALNTSCDLSKTTDTLDPLPVDNFNYDSVCFTQRVLPLIRSSCATANCHDAITHKEGLRLTDYSHIASSSLVKPFNPGGSKLYKVLNESGEDRMPRAPNPPFTSEQKAIIYNWIEEGALNSDCPQLECDTLDVISFAEQVWPVISNSCTGCHNDINTNGGVKLRDYSDVYNYVSTKRNGTPYLLGTLKQLSGFAAMPQNGRLDDCVIRKIELWIDQGALNN